jgi:hypothetical protein
MVLCPRHQRPNFHCMHAACTLPWTEDGLSLWYQTTTAADHLISIALNAATHEAQHIKIIASLQNGRRELRWPCWSGASMTDYAMGPSVIPTPRLVALTQPLSNVLLLNSPVQENHNNNNNPVLHSKGNIIQMWSPSLRSARDPALFLNTNVWRKQK